MTMQTVRLKIASPSLKLRVAPRLMRGVLGGAAIDANAVGNSFVVALDLLKLQTLTTFDPTAEFLPVVTAQGVYGIISVATLINNAATIIQIVTGAGDVAVDPRTQLLVMNRAVDQNPSNIILPLASAKVGKVKIVDFKGNSDAFPHTVKVSGADTFQGALTQWMINGPGASIICDPITTNNGLTSLGYAV